MTLMPDASYTETIQRLAGHLADVPFHRDWHVPASGVATGWRGKVPPAVMEELFWQVAGPLGSDGGDGGSDDGGPVLVLGGMPVCGIDGMLVALADTPPNRAMFGCTGTRSQKGPGSAAVPAAAGGGDHRAGGPGQARGDHREGAGRGADAAGPADPAKSRPVAGRVFAGSRSQFPRP